MNTDEAKQSLDKDQAVSERIHKLAIELELAIQEATNRGLMVDQNLNRCGLYGYPARPIGFTIRRNVVL